MPDERDNCLECPAPRCERCKGVMWHPRKPMFRTTTQRASILLIPMIFAEEFILRRPGEAWWEFIVISVIVLATLWVLYRVIHWIASGENS